MRLVRRSVVRDGHRLKDVGIACVLPTAACRDLGAELVIASDVWELSSALRTLGLDPTNPRTRRVYPHHFQAALGHADLLIQPNIPAVGHLPGPKAVDLMIEAGELRRILDGRCSGNCQPDSGRGSGRSKEVQC